MDFVTRRTSTTSTSEHRPSSESTSAPHAPPEEPEYLARYMVIKHSWRGRYKRILCLSDTAIITLDPSTLAVTNSYDVRSDFQGAAPLLGRDEKSNEFSLGLRADGKGRFKPIKFSSKYRASILTELHRIKGIRAAPVTEFPALHLRRRTLEWIPYMNNKWFGRLRRVIRL